MGAGLVTLVLARWTHVSDRAFRLLVRMAHTALDESNGDVPAGVYFGGHDLLSMTLRAKAGTPATRRREVRTVIAELVAAGALVRASGSHPGATAVYKLSLTSARRIDQTPVDNSAAAGPMEGVTPPGMEGVTPPEWRGPRPLNGGGHAPSRSVGGTTEELSEEGRGFTTTDVSLGAHADGFPPACSVCGRGLISDMDDRTGKCRRCRLASIDDYCRSCGMTSPGHTASCRANIGSAAV